MIICLRHILFETTPIYLGFRIGQKSLMRLCPWKFNVGARDRVTLTQGLFLSHFISVFQRKNRKSTGHYLFSYSLQSCNQTFFTLLYRFALLPKVFLYLPFHCVFFHPPYNIIFLPFLALSLHQTSSPIKTCFQERTQYVCVNSCHCQHSPRDS